jgi:hypothetical protein
MLPVNAPLPELSTGPVCRWASAEPWQGAPRVERSMPAVLDSLLNFLGNPGALVLSLGRVVGLAIDGAFFILAQSLKP